MRVWLENRWRDSRSKLIGSQNQRLFGNDLLNDLDELMKKDEEELKDWSIVK